MFNFSWPQCVGTIKGLCPTKEFCCCFYHFVWAAIIAQKGSDAWWYMTVEDLLPEKYREKASDYEKGTDTMDVWFDSGIITQKC